MRPNLAALPILALALNAHAASFPCTAAHTPREKAVCASQDLSAADDRLAAAYTSLRAGLSPTAASQIQTDQRDWLAWLDKICTRPGNSPTDFGRCLMNQYNTRLIQLTPTTPNGFHVYTRTHFVFKAAPPETPRPDFNDPGFGYGEFTWLQIDNPDNDQALWNTAIHDAAIRIEGARGSNTQARGKGKPPDLDLAVDTDGYRYGYATLTSANDRLLAVSFDTGGYFWGGAHGNDDITTFIWWLRDRRPLVPTDIFPANTPWQQPLADLATTALKSGNNNLWQGKELTTAVLAGVANPADWSIASNGLTITFGEYAVGPYAIGMPAVTLPWTALQPLLSPQLHPETLPAPLPRPPHPQ